MPKKHTDAEIKAAIAVLATNPIAFVQDVLDAAGCTGYLVAGVTPMGNGFCATKHTSRFVRGMVRSALKSETEREREEDRKAVADESAREDQWFEQRNTPQ